MAGNIVKIMLEDTHPPVWRRIVLPEKINFQDLHRIIQVAFEWTDSHLHDFSFPNEYFRIVSSDDDWGDGELETEVLVDEYLPMYNWIRYTYDFGDDWRHKIIFEKKDPSYQDRYATIIKAKGNGFYEDSGGVWENDFERPEFFIESANELLAQMTFPKRRTKGKAKQRQRENHMMAKLERLMKEKEDLLKSLMELNKQNKEMELEKTIEEQNAPRTPSKMSKKMEKWCEFCVQEVNSYEQIQLPFVIDTEKSEKGSGSAIQGGRRIYKTENQVSMQKLLQQLDTQEMQDYCKYLQIFSLGPKPVRKKYVEAIMECLQSHPEYVLWILEADAFRRLEVLWRSNAGLVECQVEPQEIQYAMAVGILQCECKGKAGDKYAEITFAEEADTIFQALPKMVRKREYRRLEKMEEQVLPLLMRYGVMDFEELYIQYQRVWGEEVKQEELNRFVYWHMHFGGMMETYEHMFTGKSYVGMPDVNACSVLKIWDQYTEKLPYREFDREELLEFRAGINAVYGEWQAYGDFMLAIAGLEEDQVSDWMQDAYVAVINGADIALQIDNVMEIWKPKTVQEYCELWYVLMGVLMETGLPGLKGHSRMEYEDLLHTSSEEFLPVAYPEKTTDQITARTHLYEMPSELQAQMYRLVTEISSQSVIQMKKLLKQYGGKNKEMLELLQELEEDHLFEEEYERMEFPFDIRQDNIIQFPTEYSETYRRSEPKIGRNDPCPCGSGKKYKHCCGKNK